MPEGDTIYKVACFMAPMLERQELSAVRVLGAQVPLLCRRQVIGVRSVGKHLVLTLTPSGPEGYVLRVHLGMHGTWHSYPMGAPVRGAIGADDVVLTRADGHRFVCFRPEDAEVLRVADVPHSPVLGRLGPCLLAEPFDHLTLRANIARTAADMPLIDVLLGQHIAAGLGNVYKSELLFLHGLHPLTGKGALAPTSVERLFMDGRTLLRRNLGGWPRTITADRSQQARANPLLPRYFVYGRAGAPCLRCSSTIERQLWGRHNRSCYFCPRCQPQWLGPLDASLQPQVSSLP